MINKMLYLDKKWILRYEPYLKEPYRLFNIYSSKTFKLNRSMYYILHSIQKGTTKERLTKEFDLELSKVDEILHNFEEHWYGIFSEEKSPRNPNYDQMSLENLPKYDIPIYKFPISAEIHLTEQCNLHCRHCIYSCSPYTKTKELTPQQWLTFFKELDNHGFFNAVLTGGEIFCYYGITDILRGIRNLNIHFDLLTNALLITREQAKLLHSKNIALSISMDGCRAESHDYLRGKGAFNRLMKQMDMLTEEKVLKALSVTLNAKNYLEVEGILNYAATHDCHSVGFIFLDDHGRAEENKELHLTKEMCKICTDEIHKLIPKYPSLTINLLDPASGLSEQHVSDDEHQTLYCTGGTSHMGITSEGDVYPCVYAFGSDELLAGNIKNAKMTDIWKSDKFNLMRGEIHLDDVKECGSCKLRHFCSLKNCRVRALKFRHDILGKPECNKTQNDFQQIRFGLIG
jgi:radical SAM protein with 4Fe4S-binding SPASM domain